MGPDVLPDNADHDHRGANHDVDDHLDHIDVVGDHLDHIDVDDDHHDALTTTTTVAAPRSVTISYVSFGIPGSCEVHVSLANFAPNQNFQLEVVSSPNGDLSGVRTVTTDASGSMSVAVAGGVGIADGRQFVAIADGVSSGAPAPVSC